MLLELDPGKLRQQIDIALAAADQQMRESPDPGSEQKLGSAVRTSSIAEGPGLRELLMGQGRKSANTVNYVP